jgi:WD40 repeat protein
VRVHARSGADGDGLELVAELRGAHAGDVNSVAWSPAEEGVLCTAGDDRIVRVWRLGA